MFLKHYLELQRFNFLWRYEESFAGIFQVS